MTMLGKKHSKETKEKIRNVKLGKKASEKTKKRMRKTALKNGSKPPSPLGRKMSEKTKQKIRIARKGKPSPRKGSKWSKETRLKNSGKNSYLWKGGICKNKDYVSWKKNLWGKRKREADGNHTFGQWEELKVKYNWTCPACLKKEPEIKLTEDHIVPLSKGGSDNIENIQPLCKGCNSKKHTKIIKYETKI